MVFITGTNNTNYLITTSLSLRHKAPFITKIFIQVYQLKFEIYFTTKSNHICQTGGYNLDLLSAKIITLLSRSNQIIIMK